jgi:aryl-alcohol dehydrogenase-like predicted oxidoreductase
MALIGSSTLDVFPLCLGGNVFGWTADERQSFAVLDAYVAAGGNFIDTADMYSKWVPGNRGGESETIIGRWMAARGNRDEVVIATKVGHGGQLAPGHIREAARASLERLQTDRIDLYYAHYDDLGTPQAESLAAFGELIDAGSVRWIGASNFTAQRLAAALEIAERDGLPSYVALQPEYNLVERAYEDGLRTVVAGAQLSCVPYYALASGFLTGKYRPGTNVSSARAGGVARYLDARGLALLETLDELAAEHAVSPAAVALAWLRDQPTVAAPIASARTVEQLDELLQFTSLVLSDAERARLDAA